MCETSKGLQSQKIKKMFIICRSFSLLNCISSPCDGTYFPLSFPKFPQSSLRKKARGKEREGITKSQRVRKERSKREREEGRTSEEGMNPFGKISRTGIFSSRSEEGNKCKEMEMKTMIIEIRKENKILRKELAAVREEMRGREEKWQADKEVAREERDRRKRLKIGYRKIQINGEWFIWDEREEKLRKRYYRREQMGRAWGKKRKEKVKSYREGCMERKVHIGNKWWKIMTIYSKEMKTTRRRVEDAMEENREECMLMGGGGLQRENRRKRSGRGEGGWEKKIQRQGEECRGEETDGMDRRKWMGSVEREQTKGRRRGMDLFR
ncbi:hypothetical protein GEV33_010423 [Tenebrio molitor]|uniref:Uncharacterized protein n=1 Tax=Tenebrio molitor TaxID=7067 RepID=A0A8J6HDB5_TENMO|nr:hypothetical protein GEV33_010423 [Tenebrio molitor]